MMFRKMVVLMSFVLMLGSVSNAEDIKWTDLGADHLWSNPDNWDLGRVPTLADDVLIDVPAAAEPNGPVIEDGIDAECNGIWTEAPGEPTLTMTGGSLVVGEWIWWGDGDGSFGIWNMSGGTVDVANEFELGWGGGAGTLTMTGGTINSGKFKVPTGSGAFAEAFLNGGTYNVTKPGGLDFGNENGLMDITKGTLVLEGDDTAKVNDLITAGQITAYGGTGEFELDFDARNPGKTTLTAILAAKDPIPADGAAGVSAAPKINTFASSDVPKNVPDAYGNSPRGVTSILDVADSIQIKDLNVELDITMPGSNADLNVFLTSPDGKKVKLFDDVGFKEHNFKNTILDDEASTSIKDGSGPFTGIFKPEGNLSDFDGRDTAGEWELKIEDDWNGGTATLNSWRIVVENPILVSWTPNLGDSQDVYFGSAVDVNGVADPEFIANVAGDVDTTDVGTLELGTTYYWRVDTIGDDGTIYTGETWSLSTKTDLGNLEIKEGIADNSDDAEQHLNDNRIDSGSSDLELPYEDAGAPPTDQQVIGVRYAVDLGQDATVVSAYLEIQADKANKEGTLEPVNLIIRGELSLDAAPFEGITNNITDRPTTEASVKWSIPPWTEIGPKYQSPDLSSIIQEIISQDGWLAGNGLVLIISDDPNDPSTGLREAEAGPGDDSAHLYIVAITEAASNPSPANGAVDMVQETVLSWSPGFTGVSRDVYFGTDSDPSKLDRTTGTSYDVGKLAVSTTYYWRIDEYDADGNKQEGAIWSFTTVIGEAIDPDPVDNAAGVPLDTVLSWTPGGTAVSHDISFGDSSPPALMGTTTETSFDPALVGGLEADTIYYWQVDATEADGTKHVGEIWSFKTAGPNAGAKAQYYKGMNFEELVLSRTDLPIDFEWGDGEPDPAVGADSFSVKWIAELVPVVSDTYTLSTESDDGVQVRLDGELIIDNWTDHGTTLDQSEPIELVAGESYLLEMAFYENGGGAVARLLWESPTQARRAIGALQLPRIALDPDPADGATIEAAFVMVSWTAGSTAVSHDGYIGTAPDALEFQGNLPETTATIGMPGWPVPDGLVPGTTYYWRIDEVEADPNVVHEGAVWSFTIPPVEAYDPSPADGAENVDIAGVTLSWTSGLGAKLHSVYFSDDLDTVTNAAGAPPLPMTTFDTGPLEEGKTYYWRVDEFNPPTNITGTVWSFTTTPPAPKPEPEPEPEPEPLGKASDPAPADGADISSTFTILGWTAAEGAVSHDLYISDSLDDVTAGAEAALAGNLTETGAVVGLPGLPIPDGLVAGTTYYWRVDEVGDDGTTEGDVWSFTVAL